MICLFLIFHLFLPRLFIICFCILEFCCLELCFFHSSYLRSIRLLSASFWCRIYYGSLVMNFFFSSWFVRRISYFSEISCQYFGLVYVLLLRLPLYCVYVRFDPSFLLSLGLALCLLTFHRSCGPVVLTFFLFTLFLVLLLSALASHLILLVVIPYFRYYMLTSPTPVALTAIPYLVAVVYLLFLLACW